MLCTIRSTTGTLSMWMKVLRMLTFSPSGSAGSPLLLFRVAKSGALGALEFGLLPM
jgi:hypothetical protein